MEERVAAPVGRIDAAAQIVPAADAVHRLVADDLLQHARRRRPVDPAQHQEAAVEPRREHVDEIAVDDREIVAVAMRVEQLLAHAHQRRGAAGREVEPAQQFLPARLGRRVHARRRWRRWVGAPGVDRGFEPRVVGPEAAASASKKAMRGPRGQLGVAGQDLARERHAGGFAAAGQELLAQLDQVGRALLGRRAAVARAVDQRAAALRDASAACRRRRRCSRVQIPSPGPAIR